MRYIFLFLFCLSAFGEEIIVSHTDTQENLLDKLQKSITCDVSYDFFADNTEESFGYWDTRTLFAQSLAPKCGFSFLNQHVYLGGYFILNMGERIPMPTSQNKGYGLSLHYDVSYKNFKGYFGIFSRDYLIGKYPLLYYRDDFRFFNPMLNGFLLQHNSDNIKAELLIDWYGGNIQKRIDEFLVEAFFEQSLFENLLYYGASALLYHTKNPEILNPNSSVLDVFLLDRFYYNLYVGSNLLQFMPYLDKADVKLGILGSVERKRRESSGAEPFSFAAGGFLDIEGEFRGFGIYNSFYVGDSHYKYFSEYGESIYSGLPFYQANVYDRIEGYYEHRWNSVALRFSLIFHFMKDFHNASLPNFSHQQMLTIKVRL